MGAWPSGLPTKPMLLAVPINGINKKSINTDILYKHYRYPFYIHFNYEALHILEFYYNNTLRETYENIVDVNIDKEITYCQKFDEIFGDRLLSQKLNRDYSEYQSLNINLGDKINIEYNYII